MPNRDISAAIRYHEGTKHPGGSLMNLRHRYSAADRPDLFKRYTEGETVDLPVDTSPLGTPVLEAITASEGAAATGGTLDKASLARLLYLSAGITKTLRFGWGEMAFRAASCTGALYHIELYVVCADLDGLSAGVYHYDPESDSLRRLRSGDVRSALVEAAGGQPDIADAPATIMYTDVFWRNAIKYQAREYRHAFWDSGVILAHTLAVAYACGLPARVVAGFVDGAVNDLLGIDPAHEAALALVPVGRGAGDPAPVPEIGTLNLAARGVPGPGRVDLDAIRAIHEASSLEDAETVRAWRGKTFDLPLPDPAGELVMLDPYGPDEMAGDDLAPVVVRRGSTRRFAREPLGLRAFSTALDRATRGVPADFVAPPRALLNHVYVIVNAVEGIAPGAYVYHRDRGALERLRAGDFRWVAGQLGLGQALSADAGANVYWLTDLDAALARYGNRGYRAAGLDASIAAGRMYLAAYAQGFGATGLTFYDDAVTDFFSPHAAGKSVMFLMCLGHRAGY
jgi:SagB-type dehydrogenase family enzyme